MIDENYLKYLAMSDSKGEFILKYAIDTGNDISSNISAYEADYCNRLLKQKLFVDKLVKNNTIDFDEVLSSRLPIFKAAKKTIDPCNFTEKLQYQYYDHTGTLRSLNINLDLIEDMQALGIDAIAEM